MNSRALSKICNWKQLCDESSEKQVLPTISTSICLQGAFPHPFFLMEHTDEGLKLESYFVLIVTSEIFKIFYLAITRNTGVMKKIKIWGWRYGSRFRVLAEDQSSVLYAMLCA